MTWSPASRRALFLGDSGGWMASPVDGVGRVSLACMFTSVRTRGRRDGVVVRRADQKNAPASQHYVKRAGGNTSRHGNQIGVRSRGLVKHAGWIQAAPRPCQDSDGRAPATTLDTRRHGSWSSRVAPDPSALSAQPPFPSTLRGSSFTSNQFRPQCRCGPEARPVLPMAPMTSPA